MLDALGDVSRISGLKNDKKWVSKFFSRILKDVHPDILARVIGHNKLAVRANRTSGRARANEISCLEVDPIYIDRPLTACTIKSCQDRQKTMKSDVKYRGKLQTRKSRIRCKNASLHFKLSSRERLKVPDRLGTDASTFPSCEICSKQ